MRQAVLFFICLVVTFTAAGQRVQLSTDYLSRAQFTDHQDHNHGKGEMIRYNIKYVHPLSVKVNRDGQLTLWTASVAGSYIRFNNYGEITEANPDKLFSAGVYISHIRPLAGRWSLVASLGCGIYSSPGTIGWSGLLANGGCLAVYGVNKSLSVGGGLGLTNAFGIPMVIPMGYLKWNVKGRFEFDINLSHDVKATTSLWLGKRVKMAWNIIEMDAIMSVIEVYGRTKLYSSLMLNSCFSPSFYFNKKFSIYLNAGMNFVRFSSITDRKIKYMFGGQKDIYKRHFAPALQLGIGLRYGF